MAVNGVRDRYLRYHSQEESFPEPEELKMFNLKHPPWLCQPYVRPPPEVYLEKMRKIAEEERKERAESKVEDNKRSSENDKEEDIQMSKSKRKKLEKKEQKERWKLLNQQKTEYQSCSADACNNPCSQKCAFLLCRKCCRDKATREPIICEVITMIITVLNNLFIFFLQVHKVYKRGKERILEDRENMKQET